MVRFKATDFLLEYKSNSVNTVHKDICGYLLNIFKDGTCIIRLIVSDRIKDVSEKYYWEILQKANLIYTIPTKDMELLVDSVCKVDYFNNSELSCNEYNSLSSYVTIFDNGKGYRYNGSLISNSAEYSRLQKVLYKIVAPQLQSLIISIENRLCIH